MTKDEDVCENCKHEKKRYDEDPCWMCARLYADKYEVTK
jgi:hypothetical protein